MKIIQLVARIYDRLAEIRLFLVHVISVQANAAIRSDRLGQSKRLVMPVDEVGLKSVQWLDRHADAFALGMRIHFAEPFDSQVPLRLFFLPARRHEGKDAVP